MAITSHWFLLLFLFCSTSLFFTAEAFLGVVRIAEASKLSSSTQLHLLGEDDIIDDHEGICIIKENSLILERRTFLGKVSLAGLAATTIPQIVNGIMTDETSSYTTPSLGSSYTQQSFDGFVNSANNVAKPAPTDRDVSCGNFNCLLDLPPVTPGCTRLYLCRHGQTENNRLRMMQGARVDPPINSNGYEQAERLGIAVARLRDVDNINSPTIVTHSKLRRAKETASILTSYATSSSKVNQHMKLQVYEEGITSLGEVDFGDLDGKDVNSAKSVMMSTFASWATGDIDKRAGGEGESGREVLERSVQALEALANVAKTSSTSQGSLIAVSHSTYLRILLSLVDDAPLAESVLWKINNGSVNVVDVNTEGKRRLVTNKSGIFGGLKWSNNLQLTMPECHLIRRNEVRHLDGMQV